MQGMKFLFKKIFFLIFKYFLGFLKLEKLKNIKKYFQKIKSYSP
jgi:hypothetical protein